MFPCFDWLLEEGRLRQTRASCFLLCPATIQSLSSPLFHWNQEVLLSLLFALLAKNPPFKYLCTEPSRSLTVAVTHVHGTQTHSPLP